MKFQRFPRLTKALFMSLPEFTFLVSNCRRDFETAIFEEHVKDAAGKPDQWKRIVRAGASQRACMTFVNQQQYLNFLAKVKAGRRFA